MTLNTTLTTNNIQWMLHLTSEISTKWTTRVSQDRVSLCDVDVDLAYGVWHWQWYSDGLYWAVIGYTGDPSVVYHKYQIIPVDDGEFSVLGKDIRVDSVGRAHVYYGDDHRVHQITISSHEFDSMVNM